MKYLRLALCALFIIPMLVACGGDDDDSESTDDTTATETATEATSATADASGTASATDEESEPAELTEVHIGIIPILISAPLFVGVEHGYFADEGIDLKLERLAGGADMLVQTAAGNFDIGSGGVGVAIFNAAATALEQDGEVPFEVVLPLHAESAPVTTPLVTSEKSFASGEITSVADLKGKTVSINARGAATEYWLERALQSGGLTMSDITLTEVPFNNVAAALDNGSIAAAMIGEPLYTLGVDEGLIHVLADDFVDGDQPTAVFWNRSWAEANPELAEGFIRAFQRAVADLENGGWDDPEIYTIIEKYTEVPADVVARSNKPIPTGELNIEGFKAQEEFFRQQDLLTYDDELDFSTFMRIPE